MTLICDLGCTHTSHGTWRPPGTGEMEPGTNIGGAVRDPNLSSPRQCRAPPRDFSARAAHRDDGCIHRSGSCVFGGDGKMSSRTDMSANRPCYGLGRAAGCEEWEWMEGVSAEWDKPGFAAGEASGVENPETRCRRSWD